MKLAPLFGFLAMILVSGCAKTDTVTGPPIGTEPRNSPSPAPLRAPVEAVTNDLFRVTWKRPGAEPIFLPEVRLPRARQVNLQPLIQKIELDSPVRTREIISLILEQHWKRYRALSRLNRTLKLNELKKAFESSMADVAAVEPHLLKLEYEEVIGSNLSQGIRYNSEALTVAHILREARLQCYSGTVFHILAELRVKGADTVRAERQVVIFENGHILPGYLVRGNDGSHLFGLETTVSGQGQVYFGPVTKLAGPVRVVDAIDFLLIDLLRERFVSTEKMVAAAIDRAGTANGFDPSRTEKAVRSVNGGSGNTPLRGTKKLGGTPLSFGWSEDTPGDQIRAHQDFSTKNGFSFRSPENIRASYDQR